VKKHYHKKLIRDKIPELIQSRGGAFETRLMNGKEYEKELRNKLIEEAKELMSAPN